MNRDAKGRYIKGHKHSPETTEKNRVAHLGKRKSPATEFKKGYKPWNTGKICPQLSGENNPLWKGGVTKLQKAIRTSARYRNWRIEVFERDSYMCQRCGEGGYINADHIKMLAILIQENNIKTLGDAMNCKALWEIDNGRTLCQSCHRKTDTFAWKGKKLLANLLSANYESNVSN